MRKQFILDSFGDPGFGIFVTKLEFEKSKWFIKLPKKVSKSKDIRDG
jgi:hypothetical protein